ncbi:MAG: hypothetical protein FH756_16420 [Firmicutes bacterium]|nr:hypothetical protein [Bacillota bacterium]
MNKRFPFIFPSSGNLFWEGVRLFFVNYVWLLILVLLLCIVTYADKVGAQQLKGVYQMLLAVLLCGFSIAYCLYWYIFGFRSERFFTNTNSSFSRGVFFAARGIILNALLVVLIEGLGFSSTEIQSYNFNVLLVQLMLILSVFLMPILCGLGSLSARDNEMELNDGTSEGLYVSHE